MRTILGRMSPGLDLSEFDDLPVYEADVDDERAAYLPTDAPTMQQTPAQAVATTVLGLAGVYIPPGMAPSPAVAARLAAAQANLANVRAQLDAEYAVDTQLGPAGVLALQEQQLAAVPPGAMPDDGYYDANAAGGAGAAAAVQAFREQGVDPFADDDGTDHEVLGYELGEADDLDFDGSLSDRGVDITDAIFDHPTASRHGGAAYLDPTYPLGGRSSRGPVDE